MLCSSWASPPQPGSVPLPRCGSGTLLGWKGCLGDAVFLLCKKPGVGNLGVHPGASHFLLVFWEKALAIFMPIQGGTKMVLKRYYGHLCSYLESLLACGSRRSSIAFPGPCRVRSVPWFSFFLWPLGLVNYLGAVAQSLYSFKPPAPQQTSLINHSFFLLEPQAGLYPKRWDDASSLPYPPPAVPQHPVRDFTGRGKDGFQAKNLVADL